MSGQRMLGKFVYSFGIGLLACLLGMFDGPSALWRVLVLSLAFALIFEGEKLGWPRE